MSEKTPESVSLDDFKKLQSDFAALQALLNDKKKTEEDPKDKTKKEEDDLFEKNKKEKEEAEKRSRDGKKLEGSIAFNMTLDTFTKSNKSFFGSDIDSILETAKKENYPDAISKAASIKSGMIQSFFSKQENVDLLTAGQKNKLDEYLKLTKNEKENRAIDLFEEIFEPALETMRKVKKAEDLVKAKYGYTSNTQDSYKERLMAHSKKAYFKGENK